MGIHMAHAAYCTRDTEKFLAFYRDLLGLSVAIDYGDQPSELKTGDPEGKMHVMMLADSDGSQCMEPFEFYGVDNREFEDNKVRHTDMWVPHVAFTVDGLKEFYDKLVEAGVEVAIPYVDLGGYQFAYVYDFEGFMVEFIDSSTYN